LGENGAILAEKLADGNYRIDKVDAMKIDAVDSTVNLSCDFTKLYKTQENFKNLTKLSIKFRALETVFVGRLPTITTMDLLLKNVWRRQQK
jgi:hypothetical protein